jgi:hypothetical protein
MDAELRQNERGPSPVRRRRKRRKPTRLDHRTRVGRRAGELSRHFAKALTGSGRELSIELTVAIGKAAELVALVEDMRARALRGVDVSPDDLVRMQRVADQAVRRLALPSGSAKPLSLRERLIAGDGP